MAQPKITIQERALADRLALHQVLKKNGLWLVKVHRGHVISVAHVPREQRVEDLMDTIQHGDDLAFLEN